MNLGCVHDVGRSVTVTHDGAELVRYVYAPDDPQREAPRPYFHPLRTLAGELVTVNRPHDHVWHKGLAWSLPHVGPDNFWGGRTYSRDEQRYVQYPNNGAMRHQRFTTLDAQPGGVTWRHDLAWITEAGRHIVDEDRAVAVAMPLGQDAWTLRFDTAMTNRTDATLMLGSPTTAGRENAGYGGLFWRGPRAFTGGTVLAPGVAGGDDLRGQRAPWMGFTGRHDETGGASTVVIVDHADNPAHPPQWFVRTEAFAAVCPAPFFSEEVPFEPGATLRFSYTVVVADGASDPDRAAALATLAQPVGTRLEEVAR
ncbi:hypothetical protein E1262_20685 [Jiangella aurantiaca]|uniref:Oxidoreductase n=1 Tax=Jiangella aurantiaca TaxID=2530373 RepID=A0A4R5A8B2_9ACTN|nr:PmoA family protein [Jiangella aurantiaca]TDD66894.1 hypothetical protein E1262_20685 [Jiangella aurantiaca]